MIGALDHLADRRSCRRVRNPPRAACGRRTAADRQCRADLRRGWRWAFIDGVRDRRSRQGSAPARSAGRTERAQRGSSRAVARCDAWRGDRPDRTRRRAPRPRRSPTATRQRRSARSITSWFARPIPSAPIALLCRAAGARSPARPQQPRLGRASAVLPLRRSRGRDRPRPQEGRIGRARSPVGPELAHARHRQGECAPEVGRHRRLRAARRPAAGQPGLHA